MDHVNYAIIDSDIGRLFLAATPRTFAASVSTTPQPAKSSRRCRLRTKFGVEPTEAPRLAS